MAVSVDTWPDANNRWRDERTGVVHIVGTYGNVSVMTDCGKVIVRGDGYRHTTHQELFMCSHEPVTCLMCWHDPDEFGADD